MVGMDTKLDRRFRNWRGKMQWYRGIFAVLLLAGTAFLPAVAGEIYGRVRVDKGGIRLVPEGTRVLVSTPNNTYAAVTDKDGLYRLATNEKGTARLIVYYDGNSPSRSVGLPEQSKRYDLLLKMENGAYQIQIENE